jgi:hypothetical protein
MVITDDGKFICEDEYDIVLEVAHCSNNEERKQYGEILYKAFHKWRKLPTIPSIKNSLKEINDTDKKLFIQKSIRKLKR